LGSDEGLASIRTPKAPYAKVASAIMVSYTQLVSVAA